MTDALFPSTSGPSALSSGASADPQTGDPSPPCGNDSSLLSDDGGGTLHAAYLRLRPSAATSQGCVTLMKQEAERNDRTSDALWERLKRLEGLNSTIPQWEAEYQLQQTRALLQRPELDPTTQLREALDARAEVQRERTRIAERFQAGDDDKHLHDTYSGLWKQIEAWDRRIQDLQASVQRQVLERTTPPRDPAHWSAREDQIFQALARQYTGYGEVYELLCRQVAEVRVKMEMAASSGRDVPLEEFQKLNKLSVDVIAQLQKYTETLKSVALGEEVQTAVRRILAIVEQEVATENPHLWKRVVQAIRQRVEGT